MNINARYGEEYVVIGLKHTFN